MREWLRSLGRALTLADLRHEAEHNRRQSDCFDAFIALINRETEILKADLPLDQLLRELEALRADLPEASTDDDIRAMRDRLTDTVERLKAGPPESTGGQYMLSGFTTHAAYWARKPTWSPDGDFEELSTAREGARVWLASQDAEAQVEVIRLEGDEGQVVEVVSRGGIEEITRPDGDP